MTVDDIDFSVFLRLYFPLAEAAEASAMEDGFDDRITHSGLSATLLNTVVFAFSDGEGADADVEERAG